MKIDTAEVLGVKLNIEHGGQACVASMTLVRTHYQDEGTVIVELICADGSHFTEWGTWDLMTVDGGPATLYTTGPMPAPLAESGDSKDVADQLMALLVTHGGGWGITSFKGRP